MVNFKGYIYYQNSKTPIVGATIQVENSIVRVNSDYNGFFVIPISGEQTIIFSHPETKDIIKMALTEKMDNKDLGIIYMNKTMTVSTNNCSQSLNKKVFLGFIAGLVVGKLFSSK